MRKRLGWAALLLPVIVGAGGWFKRDAVVMRLFGDFADKAVARDALTELDRQVLHIGFCGTGSPLPDRERAAACTVVIAAGRLFVFDTGDGAAENLNLMGMPLARLEGVWLTHLHSDHFEGLGPLALQRWAGTSAKTPLAVHGPPGTERVAAALTEAYRIDSGYRIAHHGTGMTPPSGFGIAGTPIALPVGQQSAVVYDRNGVRITAFPVSHAPVDAAYGYRLDWQGRSVTISGDTAVAPNIAAVGKGTDVLVHEVLNPRMVARLEAAALKAGRPLRAKLFADIPSYHATPEQAGDAAKAADAKLLAFSHLIPSVPAFMEGTLVRGAASRYSGPIWVMRDGDLISVGASVQPRRRNLID